MLRGLYDGIVGCAALCLYSAMGWSSNRVGTVYGEIILVYIRVSNSWVGAFG